MLDSLVGISIVLRLPGGVLEKAMRDAEGEEVHRIFNITMCGEQRQAYIKILTHSYSCGVLRTCPHASGFLWNLATACISTSLLVVLTTFWRHFVLGGTSPLAGLKVSLCFCIQTCVHTSYWLD